MTRLFHKELGLPNELDKFIGRIFKLSFTQHAKDACRGKNDRGVIIYPPKEVLITKDNVIEVEKNDSGQINKILVRHSYDSEDDLLIAFMPEYAGGVVKTLWLNKKSDHHKTLNKSKYTPVPQYAD